MPRSLRLTETDHHEGGPNLTTGTRERSTDTSIQVSETVTLRAPGILPEHPLWCARCAPSTRSIPMSAPLPDPRARDSAHELWTSFVDPRECAYRQPHPKICSASIARWLKRRTSETSQFGTYGTATSRWSQVLCTAWDPATTPAVLPLAGSACAPILNPITNVDAAVEALWSRPYPSMRDSLHLHLGTRGESTTHRGRRRRRRRPTSGRGSERTEHRSTEGQVGFQPPLSKQAGIRPQNRSRLMFGTEDGLVRLDLARVTKGPWQRDRR